MIQKGYTKVNKNRKKDVLVDNPNEKMIKEWESNQIKQNLKHKNILSRKRKKLKNYN